MIGMIGKTGKTSKTSKATRQARKKHLDKRADAGGDHGLAVPGMRARHGQLHVEGRAQPAADQFLLDPLLHLVVHLAILQLRHEALHDARERGGACHLRGQTSHVVAHVPGRPLEMVALPAQREPVASHVGERDGQVDAVGQGDDRDVMPVAR